MSLDKSIINEMRMARGTPKEDGGVCTTTELANTFNVSLSTVHRYTKDITKLIKSGKSRDLVRKYVEETREGLERVEEIVDADGEPELLEEIDNVKASGFWESDNGDIHMPVKRTDGDMVNEDEIVIPLEVIDNIFMDYSKTVGQGRLSSQQLILKYNLHRYHENPNRVMRVLRTRLNLNQSCDLWSYHTIYKMRLNMTEDQYQDMRNERKDEALEGRYKPDFVQQDLAHENKFLKKKIKEAYNKLGNVEYRQNICAGMDIKPVSIEAKEKINNNSMVVMMGDWHLDANYESVSQRVHKLTNDIISKGCGEVTIFGMGDWFESIVSDYMHIDQDKDIDYELMDPREKVRAVVDLMAGMLNELAENGIYVDFKMMNGNHDRIDKRNEADRYRMGGWFVSEILRYAVDSVNIKIENLANRVNSCVVGDICYIVGHGESDIVKKPAPEMIAMYGKPAKYYIIGMGHLHSLRVKSGKLVKSGKYTDKAMDADEGVSWTKVIVPPMCDGNFYSEQQIMKASAPGCIYITPNDDIPAPDITTKRL